MTRIAGTDGGGAGAAEPTCPHCPTTSFYGPGCDTVLAVGRRGMLPRFCRACLGKCGRASNPPRKKPAPGPTPLQARIGAMASAEQPPVSMLMQRFDERARRKA